MFVREIAVIGPGYVGLPMAALLATAELWAPDGTPTRVTVVQRPSASSGWKVGAINAGRSPIGALEPAIGDDVRRRLTALGHVIIPDSGIAFGGAQFILRLPRGYAAGSDPRKDGMAAGH